MPAPDHVERLVLHSTHFFIEPALAAVKKTLMTAAGRQIFLQAKQRIHLSAWACQKAYLIERLLLQLLHLCKPVHSCLFFNQGSEYFIIKHWIGMLAFLALLCYRHLADILVMTHGTAVLGSFSP